MEELISRIISRYKDETGKMGNMTEREMKLIEISLAESNPTKMSEPLQWKYFFGGCSGNKFDRYYKAEINGKQVEKHASNKGTKFAIGNIDEAKKKYKTEQELIDKANGK